MTILKKRDESAHWVGQALQGEGNDHFDYFYTTEFNLSKAFYDNKRILDVGCGPSGSLEWADNALEPVFIPMDFIERYFGDLLKVEHTFFESFGDRIYDTLRYKKVVVNQPDPNTCYILKAHVVKPK